ncbi:hypothetical protein V8B97DRAFT_1972984, partial [Scleroderma yunnanense]
MKPPAKRQRLTSTPSRSSKSSSPPTDIDAARKASAQRVLNVWSQLAERYNRRLDEDDIIDLYSGAIVKDRGVLSAPGRDYEIGHFAGDDDADTHEDTEDDDEDADELDLLPRRQTDTEDDFTTLLRGVPPLSASADASDLEEFMEAEKRRREIDEDVEDLLKARGMEDPDEDVDSLEGVESSEDELAAWDNDESTPVRPAHQPEPPFHDGSVELAQPEVIEITDTDSDSDREFSRLLQRPSRKRRRSISPSPLPLIPLHHPSPFPSISHYHRDSNSYHRDAPPSPPPPPPLSVPFDPVRAQQAQYLLAQAMHQLSYLMSATLPACSPYPTPPLSSSVPPAYDSSPSVTHSRATRARSMLPPPTRLSLSVLPPSSPTLSTASSPLSMHPLDDRCAPSRARNQTSPRKVSFKIEKGASRSSTIYRK